MKVIGGSDEAGRGCVVGPLVVAAASFDEKDIPKLVAMGVKDSKMLSPGRRKQLYPQILKVARQVSVQYIMPPQMLAGNLNRLEIEAMARAGNMTGVQVYYVDACDANAKRFERRLAEYINHGVLVIAEHHADSTYPSVSAASIIAKVERDEALEIIRKLAINMGFPDMGSGYSSDQRTIEFLRAYAKSGSRALHDQIRQNWDTWRRINKTLQQPLAR